MVLRGSGASATSMCVWDRTMEGTTRNVECEPEYYATIMHTYLELFRTENCVIASECVSKLVVSHLKTDLVLFSQQKDVGNVGRSPLPADIDAASKRDRPLSNQLVLSMTYTLPKN